MTLAHLKRQMEGQSMSIFTGNGGGGGGRGLLTVISEIQLLNVSSFGDVLAQADSHVDDKQPDRRVQQEVDHVPSARIALEQRGQVHIRHMDPHGSDALLRRVEPPSLP